MDLTPIISALPGVSTAARLPAADHDLHRGAAERRGDRAVRLAAFDHDSHDHLRIVCRAEAGEPGVGLRILVLGRAGLRRYLRTLPWRALERVHGRAARAVGDALERL